jgi:3-deoxy-manno-octulosonate cytidylyltransferase (CMP-KDO synthetase)
VSFLVVIPARFASTRLPGKPLLDIHGKPMIQRVYERAQQSAAQRVVVATDDARVADAVREFGGEVCMTSSRHESGTDRIQETAEQLGLGADQLVVNVQGDEPLIPARVIDQVAANLAEHVAADIATLCAPIDSPAQFRDPNCVKVVADQHGYALYFSRAPIPFPRDQQAGELPAMGAQRHLGIYAYRVSFLHRFITWPVSTLESTEKLEQLRAMEHGVRIHVEPASIVPPAGVDTAEDLELVRRLVIQAG